MTDPAMRARVAAAVQATMGVGTVPRTHEDEVDHPDPSSDRAVSLRELLIAMSGQADDATLIRAPDPTDVRGRSVVVTVGSARADLGMTANTCEFVVTRRPEGRHRLECLTCAVEIQPESADVGERARRHSAEVERGRDQDWRSDPCRKCRTSLMEWWKFCPSCGQDVR